MSKPVIATSRSALAVAAFALLLIAAGPAAAAVICVPVICDGTCTTMAASIQLGIDAAVAGDTVLVCPGVYPETVTAGHGGVVPGTAGIDIDKSLTLKSLMGAGVTTITNGGGPPGGHCLPTSCPGGPQQLVTLSASGITIDGFTILETDPTMNLITADGDADSDNHVIKNNVITNPTFDDGNTGGGWGILLGGTGIDGADGNLFDNNEISLNSDPTKNQFTFGIGLSGGGADSNNNNTISNNFIHDTGFGGFGDVNDTNTTVSGNRFLNNAKVGFQAFDTTGGKVLNNIFTNAGRAGLEIRNGATGIVVQNNCFSRNGSAPTTFSPCPFGGCTVTPFGAIRIEDDSPGVTTGTMIHNNNFDGNNVPNGVTDNSAASTNTDGEAENNWWGCAAGPGNPGCDSVTPNVDFTPFLTSQASGPPCPTPVQPTATPTDTPQPTATSTPAGATATSTPAGATATSTPAATFTLPLPTSTIPVPTATSTAAPLNHFQCYEIHHGAFSIPGVSLDDAFGPGTVDVGKPKRLCAPADKNDEDPTAPQDPDHLAGYKIRQRTPKFHKLPDQVVTNQFGTLTVDVLKPEQLLVPTSKSLSGAPPPLNPAVVNHFKCYKVRGKFRRSGIKVDDQFETLTVDLLRPVRLCVPADKNGEGTIPPSDSLMCYKVRRTAGFAPPPGQAFINNQFGQDIFDVFRPTELCVPSTVNQGAPTPTPAAATATAATTTATPTVTVTAVGATATPTVTATAAAATATPTVTATGVAATATPTVTATGVAATATPTVTTTAVAATATRTATPTPTVTATVVAATATRTATPTPTVTATVVAATATRTATPTPTVTATVVAATATRTATPTPTVTATVVPTATRTATPTPVATVTATRTATATPGLTPTPTVTSTPSLCGNGVLNAGEDCDPAGGGATSCFTASNTGAGFTCNASTCQCACPTELTFVGTSGNLGVLDTGWTGQGHDATVVDQGKVTVAITSCAGSSRPCGVCNVLGPIDNPLSDAGDINSQRCTGNTRTKCNVNADCSGVGGTCEYFFGSPLPLTAGGVSTCVSNQISGVITGTANIETGSAATTAALISRVYSGPTSAGPCPKCVGDGAPNDNTRGGTCDSGQNSGQTCDVNGTSPNPFWKSTSLDCPPLAGGILATLPIDLTNTTGTKTRTLNAASPNCRAIGFTASKCMCDTCNNVNANPCGANADCPVSGRCVTGANAGKPCTVASQCPGGTCNGRPCTAGADCDSGVCTSLFCSTTAGICGGLKGQRCSGGTNNGAPCSIASQCPGGACNVPGTATAFNQCDDTVCSPDVGNEGTCAGGPFEQFCGPNATFQGCITDTDCAQYNNCVGGGTPGADCNTDGDCSGGTCVSDVGGTPELCNVGKFRDCFLDNGAIGGTVTASGVVDPPTNDESDPTLASLFCVGPTSSGGVNGAAGLPGLGRLELPGHAVGLP